MAKSRRKKRKRLRKRKPRHSIYANIRSRECVSVIFDNEAEDLSYITNNSNLLYKHIKFIDASPYLKPLCYVIKEGRYAGKSPKAFSGFRAKYSNIYAWWIHIVKSCLDPDYPFYRFFGAKGISLSLDVIESKKFCKWALRRGLISNPFSYEQYLIRKNKSLGFSRRNLKVTTELEVHNCKTLYQALESLQLIKEYEEGHDDTVSYLTFHARYYVYDLDSKDARYFPYHGEKGFKSTLLDALGFSPSRFYRAVATEESCSFSVFKSRMHYSYLNGGFIARPHDMLKPEYSVSDEANKQNKLSYKQQYIRDQKRKDIIQKKDPLNQVITNDIEKDNDVYSYNPALDVYS